MKIALKFGLVALSVAFLGATQTANAQMYSNGPGFFMSLEGRYMQNSGNQTRLSPPSTATATDDTTSNKFRSDKDVGGKASMDYRFPSNWDVGVSASGLKSQH